MARVITHYQIDGEPATAGEMSQAISAKFVDKLLGVMRRVLVESRCPEHDERARFVMEAELDDLTWTVETCCDAWRDRVADVVESIPEIVNVSITMR